MFKKYPENIVCLTEESVETLALLGKLNLVKGVSIFVKRPVEAQKIPKVTQFTGGNKDKILALKPDLVLGFSDIQKDLARDLIGEGLNVFIANHRSVPEILTYILILGGMVGEQDQALKLVVNLEAKIKSIREMAQKFKRKPKVYFEEWDAPMISAIRWVSEVIEIAGGENIFHDLALESLAKERIITWDRVVKANPDIILGCWCGKRVKLQDFYQRPGAMQINAIQHHQVFELEPEIFLQPGPAPILSGLDILYEIFSNYLKNEGG